jgi:hypothetical protein
MIASGITTLLCKLAIKVLVTVRSQNIRIKPTAHVLPWWGNKDQSPEIFNRDGDDAGFQAYSSLTFQGVKGAHHLLNVLFYET